MDLSIVAGSGAFSPENRKDSDLDPLTILKNAGKKRIRIEEFIREIEMKHDDLGGLGPAALQGAGPFMRAFTVYRHSGLLGESFGMEGSC